MEKRVGQKHTEKSFLRLKINLDRFQLDLQGEGAQKCLREINRILDKVHRVAYEAIDDFQVDYRLGSALSEELMLDRKVSKLLNNLSQVYKEYRTNRVVIQNKKIVQLEKGVVDDQLDVSDVKRAVSKLIFPVRNENIHHAVIHVKGRGAQDELKKVTDMVAQELGSAEVHEVFTKSDVGSHTVVEAVFFGEFAREYDEE